MSDVPASVQGAGLQVDEVGPPPHEPLVHTHVAEPVVPVVSLTVLDVPDVNTPPGPSWLQALAPTVQVRFVPPSVQLAATGGGMHSYLRMPSPKL